ncbi:TetR/AcrR family transcriptional regulator [Streptomyces physcomitrii]|uniref:TetR/AcrR family transcriptional regulator n=1 Tax=Streptomyces physcomitrii TaxID=2724184 RepID=A0ABX1HAP6_9ACTN|nr:TetR/AcrR family transcriptional regulator [Streptomyces physcomitrii]NKI44071.1 TetR/AcrR family transcriptional regulator [Streptomyces physcomitrii]
MVVKSGQSGRTRDGRRERWRTHRAARRAEFVDAALRAFARHGPELRVEQVAAEAGVSKPVLYRHFEDKAGLQDAIHERGAELLVTRLAPALDDTASPRDRIRAAVRGYLSLIEEQPNLYWFIRRTQPGGAEAGDSGVEAGKSVIAATLAHAFDEYLFAFGITERAAAPMAHAIVGMVQSTAEWWTTDPRSDRAEVEEHLVGFIWSLIDGVLRRHGVELDPEVAVNAPDIQATRATAPPGSAPAGSAPSASFLEPPGAPAAPASAEPSGPDEGDPSCPTPPSPRRTSPPGSTARSSRRRDTAARRG